MASEPEKNVEQLGLENLVLRARVAAAEEAIRQLQDERRRLQESLDALTAPSAKLRDEIEDVLLSLGSHRTYGYGPRPIPDPIDDEVRALIRHIHDADSATRKALFSLMTQDDGSVLISFAERMATLAVRSGNPVFVREGLEALAYGRGLQDYREAIMVMSLLYHSLTLLRADANSFFIAALGLGDKDFDSIVSKFPSRKDQDRSIDAMGYSEGSDQDGFRYARNW